MDSKSHATGGSGSDSEGEEQEDPSSSFITDTDDVNEVAGAVADLDINSEKTVEAEDELSAFRQQWQRELESTPTRKKDSPQKEAPKEDTVSANDEERAKEYFLRAADLEHGGKWYEAIQNYKRAMQIVPDIETRLYQSTEGRADTPQEETVPEVVDRPENLEADEDDEDAVEGEDLLARLTRIQARKGIFCQPEVETRDVHLSCLPYEVLLVLARWVVSSELDAISLERLGAVCRGLYVLARDPDIWRTICIKTWGIECGSPRSHGFNSWRQMYVERPRLQLHGCYISKTTYLRHGENSFQDQFYRPWYIIEYYRYLRFFPEGTVLMWTTADEPSSCVGQLRGRNSRPGLGIMSGHYRLIGDKVVIVIKKSNTEKKPPQASNARFKSRAKEVEHEQTYHIELQLRCVKSRRNAQLSWCAYAVRSRRGPWSPFDVRAPAFPPFSFSRVKHYMRDARAPLTRWLVPSRPSASVASSTTCATHARLSLAG